MIPPRRSLPVTECRPGQQQKKQSGVNEMRSKVRTLVSGLGACAALGLFLVGVPVCLVTMVGNPLPAEMPEWSSVVAAIESGALPSGAVSGVLAVAVWIWWSQAALSFAAELRAARRGRTARSLPLRGLGMQPVMVRLVAVVLAAAGTVGSLAQPVLAGTPSFAEIAVPMDVAAAQTAPAAARAAPPAPVAESLPAPILGMPEVAGEDLRTVPPAPILGTPVGSSPQPPARPAASLPTATSARWDPVVARQAVARADPVTAGAEAVGEPVEAVSAVAEVVGEPDDRVGEPVEAVGEPVEVVGEPVEVVGEPVEVDPAAAPEAALPADQVTTAGPGEAGWVVVKPGDSLWLLAERHLGDALRWTDIFELNAGQLEGGGTLRDPNLIHPGWRLRLPPPDRPDLPGSAGPAAAVAATAPVEAASG